MTLIRWQKPEINPGFHFGPWTNLRDEINRLFDSSLGDVGQFPRLMSAWGPALDLYEDKDELIVKVEVPGLKKEDIEVTLQEGTLTISGERKLDETRQEAQIHRTERFNGRFQRSIALPTLVAADKVKAAYVDGILTVTLPKADEIKPKQITISAE